MQAFDWEKAPLDQNTLLEASAGTGKTYTLERLVMRLVTEREIPLPEVLVVTFTNMAAREMEERIGRLLAGEAASAEGRREELLRRAVRDFDRASLFTIHGFCARVLQTLPFECGLPPGADVAGEDELTGALVQDWFRRNEERGDPFLEQGYRAAYLREKSFPSLVRKIEKLVQSQRLEGDFALVPGPEQEALLRNLCGDWEERGLGEASRRLARECRAVGSAGEMVALLKADGLGKGLGPAKGDTFYGDLAALDRIGDMGGFLDLLARKGKTFLAQINLGRDGDIAPTSPFTKAFADWAREFSPPLAAEGGAESLRNSLALLFEFTCAREVAGERNRERTDRGKLTYNDLIDMVHRLLAGPERKDSLIAALRSRYRVLLVDEFQDTDRKQWEIFSSLFGGEGRNYFLIGDPKQSIYRFRGADLNVYLGVRDGLPRENLFRLDRNWRSHPLLMEGFNTLFGPLFGAEGRPGQIGYTPVDAGRENVPRLLEGGVPGPPVDFLLLEEEPANRDEAVEMWLRLQADHIAALLSGKEHTLEEQPLRASHIAVLLENNRQCGQIQELLSRRGIPAVIYEERDIFSASEVSLPLHFLEAMLGRDRGESVKKLLLSPLVGLTASEILFLEESGFLDSLILKFRLYRERTDRGDLIGPFSRFCRLGKEMADSLREGDLIDPARADYLGENFLVRLMGERGGERLYTNLRHILEILHGEQTRKRLNTAELARFCRSEMLRGHGDESFQVRLERDGEAVRIMTLHKSKGLQFPLVFFGGGLYPSLLKRGEFLSFRRDGENWCDYLNGSENKPAARRDEWEEKKRLYYVGLTRAESKLYLPLFARWDDNWLSRFYHLSTEGDSPGGEDYFLGERVSLPPGTALKAARTLAGSDSSPFHITPPLAGGPLRASREEDPPLREPVLPDLHLTGRYPMLTSFSSLIDESSRGDGRADLPHDGRREADHDGGREEAAEEEQTPTPENIPGGTGLGNLVHSLFEEIDYALTEGTREDFLNSPEGEAFVREKVLYHFKAEWYAQYGLAVREMVWNTLNAPLPLGEKISLNRIPAEQRIHELEFLLRLREGSSVRLGDFRSDCREGYLKGFIDLIFLWEGRYYIADWKTTRCAPGDGEPYGRESLDRIMEDHQYHLQYWIYAAALSLYLKKNSPRFDYDRDFGGIFYFFNRGMSPLTPGRGVFFTRPARGELKDFLARFVREEDSREF